MDALYSYLPASVLSFLTDFSETSEAKFVPPVRHEYKYVALARYLASCLGSSGLLQQMHWNRGVLLTATCDLAV